MALFTQGRPDQAADPIPELDPPKPTPEDEAPPAPPEKAPEEVAPSDPSICPRCQGKLTNPAGLGWCAGCGYCRSLEEEGPAVLPPEPAPSRKPSALGATEFGEAMRRMPAWAWPLLGGTAAIAFLAIAGDCLLDDDCLERALWSAIQIMVSVIGLIAAQLWAMLRIGASEEGLGAKDVIIPGRLWRAAFRHLPATRWPVSLGAWCLTAMICGAAIIGGYEYWFEALRVRQLRRMAGALAVEPNSTLRDTARQGPIIDLPVVPVQANTESRQVAQCVVIGYLTDGKTVTRLVLARAEGDRLTFAGVVKEGIAADLRVELTRRLLGLIRDEPLIPGLKLPGAVWVKPAIFCDVTHSSVDKEGHLQQPALKGLRE